MALFLISAIVAIIMLCMAIYVRHAPKSLYFTFMILSVVFFNFGYFLELSVDNFQSATVIIKTEYIGIPFIVPFLFLFVLEYCANVTVRVKHVLAVLAIPCVSALLVMTWPWSDLFYKTLEYNPDALIQSIVVHGGIAYYFQFVYTLVLIVASIGIVVYTRLKGDALFRKKTSALVIGTALPAVGYFINIIKLGKLEIDTTPIFLSVTCMLLMYSILRQGLYMLAPVAQEQIVENMNDGFILLDLHGMFINANSAAKKLFPVLTEIPSGSGMPMIEEITWAETGGNYKKEFEMTGDDGRVMYYQVSRKEIQTNGRIIGRNIIIHDITDTRESLEIVRHMAEHDALTGLINRGTLYRNGKTIFTQLGVKSSAAILMIDIDHFKRINDSYGHLNGDSVLKQVAESISSRLRITDLLGRYGGEEFCVFLPRIDTDNILGLAEKLRRGVEELAITLNGEAVAVTISIGAAAFDANRHKSFEQFLSDADAALYEAKNTGRNCIKLHLP